VATVLLEVIVSLLSLLAALVLGPSSIGEEYSEQTLPFLFTRPRSRRYLAWACWSFGICEILALVLAAVVGTFLALTWVSGYVYTWRLLAIALPLFTGAAAVYSLTYLLTVIARDAARGIGYGLSILLISLFLPLVAFGLEAFLGRFWHHNPLHFPSVLSFMVGACDWAITPRNSFPVGQFAFYLAVALAFPAIAQLVLERREV
jgi:ABC-type transport system involved in multi-copper enzyme maturation permease subunit